MNFRNPIALVFCSLIFLLALELCARLDDYVSWGAPLIGSYSSENLRYVDSNGAASCRPGAAFEKWNLDDNGFRAIAPPHGSPGTAQLRIGVLGTSETFGLFESPGGEWPAVLQKKLNDRFQCRVDVINAGCPGTSLWDMRRRLLTKSPIDEADVLLIYPTPHFQLEKRIIDGPRDADSQQQPKEQIRLVRKVTGVAKSFVPQALQLGLRDYSVERSFEKVDESDRWDAAPPERVESFRRQLDELLDSLTDTGRPIYLLTHANRFGEADVWPSDRLTELQWRRYYPHATLDALLDMERSANSYMRNLDRPGVATVDVAAGIPARKENFADFSHFSDRGAERAAELIANRLSGELSRLCAE